MTLLEEFLQKIKPSDEVEKLKMVCDEIQKEEYTKMFPNQNELDPEKLKFERDKPKGVNIFLTLKTKTQRFICLEREFKDTYIIRLYYNKYLEKSYEVKEHKTEKVLQKFAEILKFENGEA
jgi:hypothetical protein